MKSRITLLLILTLILLNACTYNAQDAHQRQLGFPFQVKAEGQENWPNSLLNYYDIILTEEHFSEQNLDRLFRYYSAKHPDEQFLIVRVYANEEKYEQCQRQKREPQVFICVTDPVGSMFDAILQRYNNNEWYEYSLDLSKPLNYNSEFEYEGKMNRVILKGYLD